MKIIRSLVCITTIIFAFYSHADKFSTIPKSYSKKSKGQVEKAEKYLNSLKNLSANFIQTDDYGNIQKGKLYLSRPGKMRWEYKDPKEILILLNNKDMIHHDKKLDQISYFCSRNDFVNLLVKDNINFNKEKIYVKKMHYDDKKLKINLAKKGEDSSMTLTFSQDPFIIHKLEVVDESLNQVDITFLDIEQPNELNQDLFEFTDHKYMRKRSNY
ncbi:MAG: outer membrane lipoprotein carrier protein LolA [Rickettsiales bacterium]